MVYVLGAALVSAYVALRYVTVSWKPGSGRAARLSSPRNAVLYAARSTASMALLAATFVFILLYAGQTPELFAPVRGPAAVLPSAVGVLFSLLALMQVAQAGRVPEFLGMSTQRRVLFVNGMFSLCRHPMYAGWLLAIWGLLLSEPYVLTVVTCSLLSLSYVLEAVYEERVMAAAFDDHYRRYQAGVPFLVPYGFLRSGQRNEARHPAASAPRTARDGKKSDHSVSVHHR